MRVFLTVTLPHDHHPAYAGLRVPTKWLSEANALDDRTRFCEIFNDSDPLNRLHDLDIYNYKIDQLWVNCTHMVGRLSLLVDEDTYSLLLLSQSDDFKIDKSTDSLL